MSGFIFLLEVAMFSHFAHLSYSLKVTFRLRFEEQINHTVKGPFFEDICTSMVIHLAQSVIAFENGSMSELLVYQLTGFLIVILVLCSLWFAVACLGVFFRNFEIKDPVAVPSSSAVHRDSVTEMEITPQVQVVVGAALHTVIQGPFRIVSLEETKPDVS